MEVQMEETTGFQKPLPQLPFLVQLALIHAPVPIQSTFQTAFRTFCQALLRQRQLSKTAFKCSDIPVYVSELEEFVDQACANLKLDREQIDPDRVIWVKEETLYRFLIRPGQWVNLEKFSEVASKRMSNLEEPHFTCQILAWPNAGCEKQSIFLSPVTEYNLRRALNILPLAKIPDMHIRPLMTDPVIKPMSNNKSVSFSPINASSVRLTRLKLCAEMRENTCDILIRDKFLINHKYACVGDIISCSLSDNVAPVDFVVSEINGKLVEHECKELFRLSEKSTKLVVDPHELSNQFHVKATANRLTNLIPPCFQNNLVHLKEWIRNALIASGVKSNACLDLWPSVLVYGPVGSSKTTVCQAVAESFGLNFYYLNAINLIGDTSAYTEGKLRAVQEQVRNFQCPAMLFLKNVHLVGKDKDGNEDKRVILAFKEFLDELASLSVARISSGAHETMSSKAVVVVGSTNFPELLVSTVAQTFLFKLEFPTVVSSLEETEETIRWLLCKSGAHLEEGVNLGVWVKENCEGMKRSYGDLKALLAGVIRQAFLRSTKSGNKIVSSKLLISVEDLDFGLKAIDSILKKAASTVEVPKVSWDDIGGLADIKKELINSVRLPLEYPHLFSSGIRRSGILLYGPPGTGKTLIAKAVATEFKLSFLSVKGPELLNMYVGQSEQNVRKVFEKARNAAPCIIFFDELDALAPNRGRNGDSGGVMDRVVSQILAELDGTHSTPDVFIIGATNRPDLIDPALLRPGRFDKLLYVGINQDAESRTNVLKALTRKFHFSEDVDLFQIAKMLPDGMSGADLYSLCSDTYMTAVERRISELPPSNNTSLGEINNDEKQTTVLVSMKDFEIAITRATSSLSTQEQTKYEEFKKMTR